MGLINELNNINYTIDRKRRDQLERQLKKEIKENYKIEIKSGLESLFYNYFEKYGYNEGYKKALLNKENNINNLYNYIKNIKIKYNNELKNIYYINFDILYDLQQNYNKILFNVKNEYKNIEKIYNDDVLEKLENYLIELLEKSENRLLIYNAIQKRKYIELIINDITTDSEDKKTLYNNYFTILNKVKKFYYIEIQEAKEEEKERIRNEREREKIKRRDNILTLYFINKLIKKL